MCLYFKEKTQQTLWPTHYVYIHHTTFFRIHLSIDGNISCLYTLVIGNDTAVNVGVVRMSLWDTDFISSGCMPTREIAGSEGNSILNFWRNLHTISHRGSISIHSQQCTRFLSPPHLRQNFFCLFSNNHPNREEQVLHCASVCVFLVINDVEHFFRYLLVICVSSFEKYIFMYFIYF